MVNPTLTYDNEYNRRLRDILSNYDEIEASRNSPTMVVGGMRPMSHIRSGNTPYDGCEGTAPFSNSMVGGSKDALHWAKFALDTGLKANRIRNDARRIFGGKGKRANRKEDALFWRDFADSTANKGLNLAEQGKKLFGGNRRANRKEDAMFWRDFADSTVHKGLNLGEQGKKLFGGRSVFARGQKQKHVIDKIFGGNKRANRKEDATFWRDFADSTVHKGLNLAEQGKKLFGGKTNKLIRRTLTHGLHEMGEDFKRTGGISPEQFGREFIKYYPKTRAYNEINKATGSHLPAIGFGKKPRAKSARGAIVSQVMKEHGLSLPQASKYVKEHGLY
jgi:hypothetical protein